MLTSIDWIGFCWLHRDTRSRGLNQKMVSHAGAVGIMQVLPSTAAGHPIRIKNVKIVDNNVHAGTKYMRFLIDQYFSKPEIDTLNRHLLALAAYNAGPAG